MAFTFPLRFIFSTRPLRGDTLIGNDRRGCASRLTRWIAVGLSGTVAVGLCASTNATVPVESAYWTIKGHSDWVMSVAYSPDGSRVASGGRGEIVLVWDVETRDQVLKLEGHTGSVFSVAYSPDGNTILTASGDNTARLWDAETGDILRVFSGHTGPVMDAAYSPDGIMILTGSADETARLWNAETGDLVDTLSGHTAGISSVAFSPDGVYLLTGAGHGSQDTTARLWNAETGEQVRIFEGHTSELYSVAYAPGGAQIATAARDETVRIWDVQSGELVRSFDGDGRSIHSVAYSSDGAKIVAANGPRGIKVWTVETGELLGTFLPSAQNVFEAVFSPDDTEVLGGFADDGVYSWNIDSGELVRTFQGPGGQVQALAVSPDGRRLFSGALTRTFRLWNLETQTRVPEFIPILDPIFFDLFASDEDMDVDENAFIDRTRLHRISVAYSPDGRSVMGARSAVDSAWHWRVPSGNGIHMYKDGHDLSITSIALSADGTRAITGSHDQTAVLWNAETGEKIRVFAEHTGSVLAVDFSPDGSRVLTGSSDGTVKIWTTESAASILTFDGHGGWVYTARYSPDGQTVLSGSWNTVLLHWNPESGEIINEFDGPNGPVTSAVFSPGGNELLTNGWDDNSVRLLDVETGETLRVFPGHSGYVFTAVFTPDGTRMFTGSEDESIKAWNTGLEPTPYHAYEVTREIGFGWVVKGESVQKNLAVTNHGNTALTIDSVSFPEGFFGDWSGGVLDPGEVRDIVVTFAPDESGDYAGTVVFESGEVPVARTAAVSGKGVSREIQLSGELDFGEVIEGRVAERILTIGNTGNVDLAIHSITFPEAFSSEWTGGVIATGTSHNVAVTFEPGSPGEYGGEIEVVSDATEGVGSIGVSGLGIQAVRRVELEGDLDFGAVIEGMSVQRILTVNNTGNVALNVESIEYPAGFSGDWTGGVVEVDMSREVTVTFSPDEAGTYSGEIVLYTDAGEEGVSIPVSGEGITATRILELSGDIEFGEVIAGEESQRTFVITNSGNSLLTVESIMYPEGFTGDWHGGEIEPGASQNVRVEFAPNAGGVFGGEIVLHSDATDGDDSIAVSGMGLIGIIELAGDMDFGSVRAGDSAVRAMSVRNQGNTTVSIDNISLPDGFTSDWEGGSIDADDEVEVEVTFAPSSVGLYGGEAVVSGTPTTGERSIGMSGEGFSHLLARTYKGHSGAVLSVAFSPDGGRILSGSDWPDSTARTWNVALGHEQSVLSGHGDGVASAVFSPDGETILTGSLDGSARIWNGETGVVVGNIEHGHSVTAAAYSPDGLSALTGGGLFDHNARVWDLETGERIQYFTGHAGSISSVAYSPDGTVVLTGSRDGTARLWNLENGEEIRSFNANSTEMTSVAFFPDGSRILTGGTDGAATMWDARTGKALDTLDAHEGGVSAVAICPHGSLILTAGRDGVARVWDISAGRVVLEFLGHEGAVYAATFSPDGTMVATGGSDRTVRLWDVRWDSPVVYFDWASGIGGTGAREPDGTRVDHRYPNLIRYALGIEATESIPENLVRAEFESGGEVAIEFTRYAWRADVVLSLEISKDLVFWEVIAQAEGAEPMKSVQETFADVDDESASGAGFRVRVVPYPEADDAKPASFFYRLSGSLMDEGQ